MDLPIDVVPDPVSLKFRWRHTAQTLVGPRTEDHVGTLGVTVEQAVADLIKLAKERQAFKDWVHAYLDAHGVPHHPPGTHGAEGCRIGDRLDWLIKALSTSSAEDALRSENEAMRAEIERLRGELEQREAPPSVTEAPPKRGRR